MNATWITVGWGHTCARISGGTVDCWGQNVYGSLGQGTIGGSSNTPVHVKDPSDNSGHLTGVATISAGQSQTCALLSGTVKCWGLNHHGQLGDSTTTIRPTPVQVGGNLTGVAAISAGGDETCAFLSGTVKCWGFNIWGELGIGYATTTSPYGIPAPVSVIDLP
jgi:alpha-tubulin suppressor-like RCC1 family protein